MNEEGATWRGMLSAGCPYQGVVDASPCLSLSRNRSGESRRVLVVILDSGFSRWGWGERSSLRC